MLRWKKKIEEELNAIVATFDYPYISGGKHKAPTKAEKLVDHRLDVVKDAVSKHPGHPLVLVGKYMGSRRLAKLEMLKRRGKGPPPKGQGKRATKRKK